MANYLNEKSDTPKLLDEDNNSPDFNKIIAISTTALGDTLLSTPAISALRLAYPDAEIHFMVRGQYKGFFESNPDIDSIVRYKKGLVGLLRNSFELKRKKVNAAFVLHVSDPMPILAALFARIPYVFGSAVPLGTEKFFSRTSIDNPELHVIEQRMTSIRIAGKNLDHWPNKMVLPVDDNEVIEVYQKYFDNAFISMDSCSFIVGFQPGASRKYRMWPAENFIELGRKLIERYKNIRIIVFGSKNEMELGIKIENGIDDHSRVRFCSCDLSQLPPMIKSLNCFVTNDTGPMHIAYAVGTPTVSLFVPSDHKRIGPFQDLTKHIVIHKDKPCGSECSGKKCRYEVPCMELIAVEEVFDAVNKILVRENIST